MDKSKRDKQGFSVQGYKPNDVGGTKLLAKPKRGKDIKVFADLPNDMQATLIKLYPNVKERKERTAMAIKDEHMYPSVIGKRGDADYEPQTAKRGKDIKTFEDLPPDVQQTIDSLSMVDGKIDQRVKANRTAIAINYQHLFPDRYNSTGVA